MATLPVTFSQTPPQFAEGIAQGVWRKVHDSLLASTTAFSAPGAYVQKTTLWQTATAPVGAPPRIVIAGLDPTRQLAMKFYGADANNEQFRVRLWGISEFEEDGTVEYFADHIADLEATLGAAIGTGGAFPNTTFFADTITVIADKTLNGSIRIATNSADAWAQAIFDAMGYMGLITEFSSNGTTTPAASFGAAYRVA